MAGKYSMTLVQVINLQLTVKNQINRRVFQASDISLRHCMSAGKEVHQLVLGVFVAGRRAIF